MIPHEEVFVHRLRKGDRVLGTKDRVFSVVDIIPDHGHDMTLVMEGPDGQHHKMSADMWMKVKLVGVLDEIRCELERSEQDPPTREPGR